MDLQIHLLNLDDAIAKLYKYFQSFLNLQKLKNHLSLMADEIEKTRRRVNALEYMTIPQLTRNNQVYKNET